MSARKALVVAAFAVAVFMQPAAAQGDYRNGYYNDRDHPHGNLQDAYRDGYRAGYQDARRHRNYDDRPPNQYSQDQDYQRPYEGGTGDDRDARWRHHYGQTYDYNSDSFYQQCRNQSDPAGVIAGALIGGLIGNAAGGHRSRTGATIAGVVVGGAVGAALTNHLNCDDRSYAYKTYSDAFNSGRPNSDWQWSNPRNGHNGDFRVGDYYNDPDGFRCTTYTQRIYVEGAPQTATGQACQQPDGSWAIVS
jgi:surface antigen